MHDKGKFLQTRRVRRPARGLARKKGHAPRATQVRRLLPASFAMPRPCACTCSPKKPKKHPLTPTKKRHNRQLARTRVRVEHAIAGVKISRIAKDQFHSLRAKALGCSGRWGFTNPCITFRSAKGQSSYLPMWGPARPASPSSFQSIGPDPLPGGLCDTLETLFTHTET